MNDRIKIKETNILSDSGTILENVAYDFKTRNGSWKTIRREVYKRKNATAILLYNPEKKTVILTRQFRLPTYLKGNPEGFLLEACAGMIEDNESTEDCIIREVEEEVGYQISHVQKVFEAYMTPGATTEIIQFFVSDYSIGKKISEGGGLADENEDIEVVELNFNEAFEMIKTGEIRDAKTIMLLQYAMISQLIIN